MNTTDLADILPDWEARNLDDGKDYGDIIQIIDSLPTTISDQPGFSPWAKFLMISTIIACLFVGAVLSQLDFFFTPAKAGSQQGTVVKGSTSIHSLSPDPLSGSIDETKEQDDGIGSGECLVSDRFPPGVLRWCDLISQNARKRGLPPDLVAAVILQESGGNPNAYSRSGAVGLMQVMPNDGVAASFMCVSGPCFANRPSSNELEDPAFNISYGTEMLAGLVGKSGSLRDGLKSFGPMDIGYYYVDKVMGLYQRYGN
jgi:hypothetical protein